ncbi:hypothetical protein HDU96_008485 [Phlyctochytrium bullatum]|nr:hypothetical protein HDU96_008485 [Phlyctochytrium bullatum]
MADIATSLRGDDGVSSETIPTSPVAPPRDASTRMQPLELLAICLGDSPDKAFSIDIDAHATVSRLRSTVATCTRHVASDLNLFAVRPGAGLILNDPRIAAFLASVSHTGGGVVRIDPVLVETHLPVTWLREPTDSVAAACIGDGRDSRLDPVQKARQLRIVVALDGRTDATGMVTLTMRNGALGGRMQLPPPAYDLSGTSDNGSSVGAAGSSMVPQLSEVPSVEKIHYDNTGTFKKGAQDFAVSGHLFNVSSSSAFPASTDVKRPLEPFKSDPPYFLPAVNPITITNSSGSGSLPLPSETFSQHPSTGMLSAQPTATGMSMASFDGRTGAAAAAVAAEEAKALEAAQKKKRVVLWVVAIVATLVLLGAGIALGMLLSKKDSGQSNTPATTTTATSTTTAAPTSSPTAAAKKAGELVRTLMLPASNSPALLVNPLTNTSFFVSGVSGRFVEAFFNGTTSPVEYTAPQQVIHGMIFTNNTLICADSTGISFFDASQGLKSRVFALSTPFLPSDFVPSQTQVRFSGSGPAQGDEVFFVVNEAYGKPANNSGFIAFLTLGATPADASVAPVASISFLRFPNITEGFPWSALMVTSTRLIVSMSTGVLQEYRRTDRGAAWTRTGQFLAHPRGGARTMIVAPKNGYLLTGGLDDQVRVWDLEKMPFASDTAGATAPTPVAAYTGFGGSDGKVPEVYDVALTADETLMVAGGDHGRLVAYKLPQRNDSTVQTSVLQWYIDVRYQIYHVAYFEASSQWLVTGDTGMPWIIQN